MAEENINVYEMENNEISSDDSVFATKKQKSGQGSVAIKQVTTPKQIPKQRVSKLKKQMIENETLKERILTLETLINKMTTAPMQQSTAQPMIITSNRFADIEVQDDVINAPPLPSDENEDPSDNENESIFTKIKNKNKNKQLTSSQKGQQLEQPSGQQQQPIPTRQEINSNVNNKHNNNNNLTNNNNKITTSSIKTTTIPTTTTNNTNINNNNTNNNKYRPPPIHIQTQEISDTIKLCKGMKLVNFNIKRINKTKHSVYTDTIEDYNKAKEVFTEAYTPYFTYTPKTDKHKSIVLKGLHEDENTNDIQQYLIEKHKINVIAVTQLKTKISKNTNNKIPLFIVKCSADTNMGQLFEIKTINYQMVSWEQLKKREGIIQCHKCQRFGHVAINCNLLYRCVKCNEVHSPGKCKITEKVNNLDVFCTNCNATGHPASYRGCPTYQATWARYKQRIEEQRANRGQQWKAANIPITKNTFVNTTSGTFAEMLQGGRQQVLQQQQRSTQQNQQPQQQQQPQTTEITMLTQIIQKLSERVNSLAETTRQQGEQIGELMSLFRDIINE